MEAATPDNARIQIASTFQSGGDRHHAGRPRQALVDADGSARFMLDQLTGEQVAAIVKAVLADKDTAAKIATLPLGDRRKLRASRYASNSISKAALSMTMVMLPPGYKSPLPLCRTATPG